MPMTDLYLGNLQCGCTPQPQLAWLVHGSHMHKYKAASISAVRTHPWQLAWLVRCAALPCICAYDHCTGSMCATSRWHSCCIMELHSRVSAHTTSSCRMTTKCGLMASVQVAVTRHGGWAEDHSCPESAHDKVNKAYDMYAHGHLEACAYYMYTWQPSKLAYDGCMA